MGNFIEYFFNILNIFDLTVITVMLYCIIQCFLKGFFLSIISFMKWVVSLILTIILVPKFQPWVSGYIESQFINNFGVGIFIFIVSLFTTILIGRAFSRAVTWTGMGSVDKSFGIIFGIFKGYIVTVCLFSILNWFYPYQNWGIAANEAISFDIVNKSSRILIDEFPSSEDFIDTKENIEKI